MTTRKSTFKPITRLSELNLRYGSFPMISRPGMKAAVIYDHQLRLGTSPDGYYDGYRLLHVLVLWARGRDADAVTSWSVCEGLSAAPSEFGCGPDIQWISEYGSTLLPDLAIARLRELNIAIAKGVEYHL